MLYRRAARIYPTYWIALAVYSVGLWYAYPGELPQRNLIGSVLLLPATRDWILGVAWTLPYELMFYCVFAFSICFSGRARVNFVPAAFVVVVAAVLLGYDAATIPNMHVSYFIEFLLGFGVIKLCRRTGGRSGIPAIVLGVVAVAASVVAQMQGGRLFSHGVERVIAVGLPVAVFVYGAIAIEIRRDVVAPAWLARTGDWSFSLYLLHSVVTLLFLATPLVNIYALPITLAYVASAGIFVGTIVGSAVFAECIDLPLYGRLKRIRVSIIAQTFRRVLGRRNGVDSRPGAPPEPVSA